eukprot:SAG31_NODE_1580_length_7835_cov_4.074457_5_plen_107_part_00
MDVPRYCQPEESKARNRASDVMQHYIELDIPETRIREQPAIENVEAPEPDSVPQVTACWRWGHLIHITLYSWLAAGGASSTDYGILFALRALGASQELFGIRAPRA